MSYRYEDEKEWLFTDGGQRALIRNRDRAFLLLDQAGAFMIFKAARDGGETWKMMATMDRLVELGDIREITGPEVAGQHRVFVKP